MEDFFFFTANYLVKLLFLKKMTKNALFLKENHIFIAYIFDKIYLIDYKQYKFYIFTSKSGKG